LNIRIRGWQTGTIRRGVTAAVVLIFVAGCRSGQQSDVTTLLGRISNAGRARVVAPGELAAKGRAAILAECDKQSYETARKGLIVSETGFHEDVFALRDRLSYAGDGYNLDEALRLEALLQTEAKVAGLRKEQVSCIEEFAAHLGSLTEPLVEADERQKELDASAFRDSTKEADAQVDKKLREAEKLAAPPSQEQPELLPKDY
jgi:hypothetical protein